MVVRSAIDELDEEPGAEPAAAGGRTGRGRPRDLPPNGKAWERLRQFEQERGLLDDAGPAAAGSGPAGCHTAYATGS